eukprot:scaffold3173_cov242-Pinguiococcus_pyrenoidosus.AAC.10
MVGIVWMTCTASPRCQNRLDVPPRDRLGRTSPNRSEYKIVVLPAPSRPSMRMRFSRMPHRLWKEFQRAEIRLKTNQISRNAAFRRHKMTKLKRTRSKRKEREVEGSILMDRYRAGNPRRNQSKSGEKKKKCSSLYPQTHNLGMTQKPLRKESVLLSNHRPPSTPGPRPSHPSHSHTTAPQLAGSFPNAEDQMVFPRFLPFRSAAVPQHQIRAPPRDFSCHVAQSLSIVRPDRAVHPASSRGVLAPNS